MNRQHTILYTICSLLAAGFFLSGCTRELDFEGSGSSQYIRFQTSIGASSSQIATRSSNGFLSMEEEDWPLVEMETKAAPQTALSGDAGLIGFTSASAIGDTPATAPWASMYDQTFDFDNEELKAHGAPIKWSATNSYLRVYAYAPKDFSAALSADDVAGVPTLTYTVPTAVASQTDLLAAVNEVTTSTYKASGGNMPLNFNHALTAIRFKVDFACTVEKLEIKQVYNNGVYKIGGLTPSDWTGQSTKDNYTFYTETFTAGGTAVAAGGIVTDDANTLMLMPQTVPADATVVLTFDSGKTITASIAGHVWEPGKRITYTISQTADNYIYFDLALGDITINDSSYSGKIIVNGEVTTVSGIHNSSNEYYVYQSTSANRTETGWPTTLGEGICSIPNYASVTFGGKPWRDYITNRNEDPNTNVKGAVQLVSEAWATSVESVGRQFANSSEDGFFYTDYKIDVRGAIGTCNMLLNNIYTRYQPKNDEAGTLYNSNHTGSITYLPSGTHNKLVLDFVGDNWLGSIRYFNNSENGNQLILQGTGSLSVANHASCINYAMKNWASCIGGSNDGQKNAYGIVINSGVYFVGATIQDNASAIGGGSNGHASIIINGGTVTAVTASNSTALGGGGGRNSFGGNGIIEITGGDVYAYNFKNPLNLPSAAIGGAGTSNAIAGAGTFSITGGNVYAQSSIGTAIGGGSSLYLKGGDATVNISGGNVIAKSISYLNEGDPGYIAAGCGIGGGTACSGGGSLGTQNGGNATITISGGSILTGSIGGGRTGDTGAKKGYANIAIDNGDIQGQFVMEAGTSGTPSFTMTGGRIRNSNTSDANYAHIVNNGGAVYIEDGTFTMSAGTIENCSADRGGAVYVGQSGTGSPSFTMSGTALIQHCSSTSHGGAVYLEGGSVTVERGTIDQNRSSASGGGIYVSDGDFAMSGGDITGNYAATYGGGVAVSSVDSDVTVNITGGNITDNSCGENGGGLSVVPAGGHAATVNLGVINQGLTNPDISANNATRKGGGVYASGSDAAIVINSGRIIDNTVSTLVANPDVANDGGLVTLNAGDVTHVVVTYHMNDGANPEVTDTQLIVTAVRSILSAPTWSAPSGYTFGGWYTNSAGTGDLYINGQEVNLTTGLHLYAKWTPNP